jgi:hypothetical protein
VSPVKYKLGFYIPEDDILHSRRCENHKSYTTVVNVRSLSSHYYIPLYFWVHWPSLCVRVVALNECAVL